MTPLLRLRWRAERTLPVARVAGVVLLALVMVTTIGAPVVAPNPPTTQFADRAYAPPMSIRVRDASGFRAPFVYPQVLQDRLGRVYVEDRARPATLRWFTAGRLISIDSSAGPLLLFGGDALGRDVLARTLHGGRLSLGVTALGVIGALLVGVFIGGLSGTLGGRSDLVLMTLADFVLVLPAAYLVLVLRGVLPLVLETHEVFGLLTILFTVAAWPHVARGVRAIVAAERHLDYAEGARAAGAGSVRLAGHLLPAARGFLAVEAMLLAPALLSAEATVSYLGLGFPEPRASWGTQLQEAATIRAMSEAPWMLAPAAAIFVVVLGAHLAGRARDAGGVLTVGVRTPARASVPTSGARPAV
ncbi:MAG TPA: ABC transporter permease [Vicinamibacterales bacterium]|nr:ABC transporter permease [Vicinamibacterales bacterium]